MHQCMLWFDFLVGWGYTGGYHALLQCVKLQPAFLETALIDNFQNFLQASKKALNPVAPIYKYCLVSVTNILTTTCQYEVSCIPSLFLYIWSSYELSIIISYKLMIMITLMHIAGSRPLNMSVSLFRLLQSVQKWCQLW